MAVIKIMSRHSAASYSGTIHYQLKKEKNVQHIFTHNLHSNNPQLAIKEFLQNESFRANGHKRQIFSYHEVISFSPEDTHKITPQMIEDIGRKYIELRGTEGLYYGCVHTDRSNTHFHFCVSGTKLSGKAMRLSMAGLRQLKTDFQTYYLNKYPELEKSAVQHGTQKQYIKDKEWHQKQRVTMKAQIEQIVTTCLEKAGTQQEFLDLLRENDLHHYERKQGELTGIIFEDNKFRFTRLGIDLDKLQSLPIDLTQEQKALKEIEEIRLLRESKELTNNRMLQFEENGYPKTVEYNNDTKTISWRDPDGIPFTDVSDITLDEKEELDKVYDLVETAETEIEESEPLNNIDHDLER